MGPSYEGFTVRLYRRGKSNSPQRRRDILRAAAELFAVHGYNGVSLHDIAGRANVPVALCTYYFGRKSELFASVFLHSSDHIEKRRAALQAFPESGFSNNCCICGSTH